MRLIHKQHGTETRTALLDDKGRLQELYIQRTDMLNLGERVVGIIRKKNAALRGYFIETDKKLSVFVPSKNTYAEGAHVVVEITKEARLGKDANGIFVDLSPAPAPDKASILSEQFGISISDEWDNVDEQIESLLEPRIAFDGTATLTLERTAVCHTIDVDTGAENKSWDKVNAAAIPKIVRQIRLRGLAGVILIDFAGRKFKDELRTLVDGLKKEFSGDTRTTVMGATSLGLIEIQRTRTYACLADLMQTPNGKLNAHAVAYQILSAVKKVRGAVPIIRAHPSVITLIQEGLSGTCKLHSDVGVTPDFYEIKENK